MSFESAGQTIGILYCGDMGVAVAKALLECGHRVVTTCSGRSDTTRRQAESLPVEILPSVESVIAESDVVFSLVLPSKAHIAAMNYIEHCPVEAEACPVFVDGNSSGLEAIKAIEEQMKGKSLDMVDASILGASSKFQDVGVLNLSGPAAPAVESLFGGRVQTRVLGEQIGTATFLKVVMTGLSKSLITLFLEVATLAEETGMLPEFLDSCRMVYPGVMLPVDRSLPTYPRHAKRRIGEMQNVEQLSELVGMRSGMVEEGRQLLEIFSKVKWDLAALTGTSDDLQEIIKSLATVRKKDYQSSFHETK